MKLCRPFVMLQQINGKRIYEMQSQPDMAPCRDPPKPKNEQLTWSCICIFVTKNMQQI